MNWGTAYMTDPGDWPPPSFDDRPRPTGPPTPGPPPPPSERSERNASIGGRAFGTATVATDDGIEWCRPHPYTLIIEFVSSIRDLIIPILFLMLQGGGLGELLPLVAIVLPLGAAVTRYYSTRYALTEDALLHDYGVFKKHKQVLPRRNIQNLSTSAGLIARATGMVEIIASDASQGGDVKLRLLSVEDAERLMTLLREDVASTQAAAISAEGADDSGLAPPTVGPRFTPFSSAPVHSTTIADLIKFTLATSGGAVVAILLVIALVVVFFAFPDVFQDLSVGSAVVAFGMIAAIVVPAVSPILSLGGFRLWSDPDRLRFKTGLLTEVQVSARRERMQMVQVDRHLVARRLGLEAIRFETADVETGTARVNYLAPAVAFDSWRSFASDALGEVELAESDLHRVSPLTRRRSLFRHAFGSIPLIILFAVVAGFAPEENRTIIIAVAIVTLVSYASRAVWHANRRAARLGWALGDDQFLFRTGVVAEKLYLVRKEKLQTLRLDSSVFQRRLGLATITLGTAGVGELGLVSLPDLELAVAEDLLARLSEASAATPLSRTL